MSRLFQYFSALTLLLILTKPSAADPPDTEVGPPLKITMRVYNYAHLPSWTMERTRKETTQIFGEVGIEPVWVDCPTSDAEIHRFQGCLNRLGPTDVVLKIIPRFQSKREGFRDTLFGFAAGFQISVVFSRVEEVAKDAEASRPQILAVAIAHEIGHVLLGPNSHSSTGVMRSQWNEDEFRRSNRQAFHFTPEQAQRLQAELFMKVREEGDTSRKGVPVVAVPIKPSTGARPVVTTHRFEVSSTDFSL